MSGVFGDGYGRLVGWERMPTDTPESGDHGAGAVEFPTEMHRQVLDEVMTELVADSDVRGVALGGSLSRGTARPDSDLDVLVVTTEPVDPPWRTRSRLLPVDFMVRTAGQWRAHFAPARVGDESWGYAFVDAVALHDPDGIVVRLAGEVADTHAHYRVPPTIKEHYAALWRHVRPKMLAVLRRGDPVEVGWTAAVMTNEVLRTVWAANDRPNPSLDLGTVQRHLADLTIPADAPELIRALLRAAPRQALTLQLDLLALVEPHLDAG